MKCPKCNSENPPDTRFCGNCGTPIRASAEPSISSTETLLEPLKDLTRGILFANRYEVIEELGRGGMGIVYRVFDRKIDEEVALKLLRPEIAWDSRTTTRFKNELKFARKIIHKNVCRMYDINEEKGNHFITMEYVQGEDLKTLIKAMGQFTLGKAVFIAKQICEGLAEAHKLGVVHRDLKAHNIMIDREGNAHIMDFGIARSLQSQGLTTSGIIIGSPHYMSPEQVEGKEVDQRADIYALGVILFEMLTAKVPFEGDTPLVVAVKHKSESPPDPRKLNPQLTEEMSGVILKCLEKNKFRRYQKVEELLEKLIRIEKEKPTTDRILPEIKFEMETSKKHIVPKILFFTAVLIVGSYFLYNFFLKKEGIEKKEDRQPAITQITTQKAVPLISQTGYLEIDSLPQGAEVYISNKLEGLTPLRRELRIGSYAIKIKKSPEYKELADVINIKAGETYSKNYPLAAASQPGILEINSTPKEAEIYINDKREGLTPFKRELPPGTYKIRIKKSPEYKEIKEILNVNAYKTVSKNYTLNLVYILNLKTDPAGADVSIDGNHMGKTPMEIELQNNTCRLRIEKGEEWSSIDEVLTLDPGLNYLQRALKSINYSFTLSTNPPGASVFIGKVFTGISPLKISNLFGTYEIKIEKEGYKTIQETIVIKSDGNKLYDLEKIKILFAKIRFKADPYADVYVDGKIIGEVPPIRTQEVKVGKHKIEFVSTPLNKKYTVEVEIKTSENIEIRMNMQTGEYKVDKINIT